jgi:anti-anti-sigma factor
VGIGYARGWGQLTVQVVAIDDYGLLLSGEVDMEACEEFREFAELAVDGRREVVLDVVDLAFLDSAGVRAILRLAVCSMNASVRDSLPSLRGRTPERQTVS